MTFDNETLEWEEGQGDDCESDNEHEELNNGASEDEHNETEESSNVEESEDESEQKTYITLSF